MPATTHGVHGASADDDSHPGALRALPVNREAGDGLAEGERLGARRAGPFTCAGYGSCPMSANPKPSLVPSILRFACGQMTSAMWRTRTIVSRVLCANRSRHCVASTPPRPGSDRPRRQGRAGKESDSSSSPPPHRRENAWRECAQGGRLGPSATSPAPRPWEQCRRKNMMQ